MTIDIFSRTDNFSMHLHLDFSAELQTCEISNESEIVPNLANKNIYIFCKLLTFVWTCKCARFDTSVFE